jgi:hypothetical protein
MGSFALLMREQHVLLHSIGIAAQRGAELFRFELLASLHLRLGYYVCERNIIR